MFLCAFFSICCFHFLIGNTFFSQAEHIMISNQLLQKTIDELKSISNADFILFDMDGRLSVTTSKDIGPDSDVIREFADSPREYREVTDYRFFKVKSDERDEYVLVVTGLSNNEMDIVGRMAKYQVETLISAYKDRFDKDSFLKSLIMDNLMLIDIFERSKKLHIGLEAKRVALIVEMKKKNQDDAIGTVKNLFSAAPSDGVIALTKKSIVVVKQLEDSEGLEVVEGVANRILNAVKSDTGEEPVIAFGSIVEDLKDVSKSFKEAKMAMEVGKIFQPDNKVISYNRLDVGRLIYQLPMPLCKMFLQEIFGNQSPQDFDEEMLTTINKFFENNLNVSETSRQLFIHRNTLVYRLDKIQKITGLDLRIFDDAITFKIALMVSNYMNYVEKLEYK